MKRRLNKQTISRKDTQRLCKTLQVINGNLPLVIIEDLSSWGRKKEFTSHVLLSLLVWRCFFQHLDSCRLCASSY